MTESLANNSYIELAKRLDGDEPVSGVSSETLAVARLPNADKRGHYAYNAEYKAARGRQP